MLYYLNNYLGKRQEGRSILLDLSYMLMEILDEVENFHYLHQLIIECILEVSQSAMIDNDINILCRLKNIIADVEGIEYDSEDADYAYEYSNYLKLTKIISHFDNKDELEKLKDCFPFELDEKMCGGAEDFYIHSMGRLSKACLQ